MQFVIYCISNLLYFVNRKIILVIKFFQGYFSWNGQSPASHLTSGAMHGSSLLETVSHSTGYPGVLWLERLLQVCHALYVECLKDFYRYAR